MLKHLIPIPAGIDPHVHFRTPGHEYKEDWVTASQAALCGGICMVIDMPNNDPACITQKRLIAKRKMIDQMHLPIRYDFYLGADQNHLEEIAKSDSIAVKVFMGSSTGTLLMDDQEDLEQVFRKAKLVAVHAEDETILRNSAWKSTDPADHSRMRPNRAAAVAVERAINLCRKYGTKLYILHMSTKEEVELVRRAKKEGLPLFAEVTPHHLFLSTEDYSRLGTLAQMNPPLRSLEDQEALWDAISDGTIDTLGSDHAPHTLEEKRAPYGKAPSGVPGIETMLPLMLDAVNRGRLTLERLVEMSHFNILKIFDLPPNDDVLWVDMQLTQKVEEFKSKCGWSPFQGRVLTGWPQFIRVKGKLFSLERTAERPQFLESGKALPPYDPQRWRLVHDR